MEKDWKELAKRLNKIFETPGKVVKKEEIQDALHEEPAQTLHWQWKSWKPN